MIAIRNKWIASILFLSVLVGPQLLFAADGYLDTSFHPPDGYTLYSVWNKDSYTGSAIQTDGKIILSGGIQGVADTDVVVLRYTSAGNLDADFGTKGVLTYDGGSGNDCGRLLALQSDGRIVMTGYTQNGTSVDVLTMRINTNGTLDGGFGANGIVTYDNVGRDDYGRAVGIQSDGKIVVAARSSDSSTSTAMILRYNKDGTLDGSFGTNGVVTYEAGYGNDGFRGLVIQGDGRIVASGYTKTSVDFDVLTVRYNSNGTPDSSFGKSGSAVYDGGYGDDGAHGIVMQADNRIVVSGGMSGAKDLDVLVLRYNSDGNLDTSFAKNGAAVYDSGNGNDYGRRPAVQTGNRIIVTGRIHNGTNYDLLALRYNADGALDFGFGAFGVSTVDIGQGNDYGEGVVIQADNNIVISGGTYNGSNYAIMAIRLIGGGSGEDKGGCFINTAVHGF